MSLDRKTPDSDDRESAEETLFELISESADGGPTSSGELDFADEEFSLEQLGAAYARVIRGDAQFVPGTDPVPETSEDSDENEGASGKAIAEDDSAPQPLSEGDDDRHCPVSEESVLEAVLFVGAPAGTRLTARKLAGLMREVSPREIRGIVDRLNNKYELESSAWRIVNRDGGYQLELIEQLRSLRDGFQGEVRQARLPQSAIDVLAIVAYHQPISRSEVEQISLRPGGAILANLVQRRLISVETADKPDAARVYVTTGRFLELLGLSSLHDLPLTAELPDLAD